MEQNNQPLAKPLVQPKKKKNANSAYILIGLAVLVVFVALIIMSVMKRNPLKDSLVTDSALSLQDTSVDMGNALPLNEGVSIDRIDVMILESFPVQVNALVRGNLADGCLAITDASARRDNNVFTLDFQTVRRGEMCTQALVPFERSVPLPVSGLRAGTYTVTAGEVTATFKLTQDNTPIYESDK